ncbi:unnamed protein product [Boreogadus saida]
MWKQYQQLHMLLDQGLNGFYRGAFGKRLRNSLEYKSSSRIPGRLGKEPFVSSASLLVFIPVPAGLLEET